MMGMTISPPRLTLLFLSGLLTTLGCASSSSFHGARYENRQLVFRVGPRPPSWKQLDTSSGLLAFRDESQQATVLLNGRCGRDGDDVPLTALTRHLFLQFTEREILSEKTIPLAGREALRTTLHAKLDGVALTFVAIVLKKNGCVYDFIMMAEPQNFATVQSGFDAFVGGFQTERP